MIAAMKDTLRTELERRCIRLFGIKCQWTLLKALIVGSISITAAMLRLIPTTSMR